MTKIPQSLWNELNAVKAFNAQELEHLKRYEAGTSSLAFVGAAEAFRQRGRLLEAIVILEEGIKRYPQLLYQKVTLGRDYFCQGMMPEARKILKEVLRLTPENLMAQRLMLKLDLIYNDQQSLIQRLDWLKQLHPDDEFTSSIRSFINAGDLENAKILLESDLKKQNIVYTLSDDALSHLETDAEAEAASIPSPQDASHSDEPSKALTTSTQNSLGFEDLLQTPLFKALNDYRLIKGEEITTTEQNLNKIKKEDDSETLLESSTLAEIYVSQGMYSQALRIYNKLHTQAPDDDSIKHRLNEVHELQNNSYAQQLSPAPVAKISGASAASSKRNKKLLTLQSLLKRIEERSSQKP